MANPSDDPDPVQGVHESVVKFEIDNENKHEKITFLTLPPEIRHQIYVELFQNLFLVPINTSNDFENFEAFDWLKNFIEFHNNYGGSEESSIDDSNEDNKDAMVETHDKDNTEDEITDEMQNLFPDVLAILLVNHECHDEAEAALWQVATLRLEGWNDGDALIAKVPARNLDRVTKLHMPFCLTRKYIPQRLQDLFPNLKEVELNEIDAFGEMCSGPKYVNSKGEFKGEDFCNAVFVDLMTHVNKEKPRVIEKYREAPSYQVKFLVDCIVFVAPEATKFAHGDITWDGKHFHNGTWMFSGGDDVPIKFAPFPST